jgi:histidinol-phosphate aminotransferase
VTGDHGGVDALGAARFDFSTNSNACGPCPHVVAALKACDATRYPDPAYTALRQQLADFHGVELWRVVLAASASEFIYRITAWVAQHSFSQGHPRRASSAATVCVPPHAYGDYAQAARAWGLEVATSTATTHKPAHKKAQDSAQNRAPLVWACEPSSPLGTAHTDWPRWLVHAPVDDEIASGKAAQSAVLVLDCAYAPLRLSGSDSLPPDALQCVWQLWTPNKALGLTGVRGAYAIAPTDFNGHAKAAVDALNALCPSWPVGAHGVALLQSWVQPEVQSWLTQSLVTLRSWKERQIGVLQRLGWTCLPSDTNFFCARPLLGGRVGADLDGMLASLRTHGIKLRDAASFGLPSHVRLSVQPPVAQDALARAWRAGYPIDKPVLCVSN